MHGTEQGLQQSHHAYAQFPDYSGINNEVNKAYNAEWIHKSPMQDLDM